VVQIISGVERRRRWRPEEKLRVVAELEQPGACFAEVARRHDVSRGLLWNWRRQVRDGTLGASPGTQFVPVQVMANPLAPSVPYRPDAPPQHEAPPVPAGGSIEITLPDGITLCIRGEVNTAMLRSLLGVLRR
jgi:transposase